jgi:phosphosulfolactate phosphohydrolase-like enzyme
MHFYTYATHHITHYPGKGYFMEVLTAAVREKITQKAYERFVARGKKHGFAMEDWILAEKEVLNSGAQVAKPKEKPGAKDNLAAARQATQHHLSGMKVTSYA